MLLAEDLKKSVIQAAIQGKLVKQCQEDGNAEELIQHVLKKREELYVSGKIKKGKNLPEISDDEMPFDIPETWKWIRLGDLTSKIGAGSTPLGGARAGIYTASGIPFIREMNVYNDGIHREGMVYISKELSETRENSKFYTGDILLNITGGSIGRCAIVPDDIPIGDVNQHVEIIRLIDKRLSKYIHLLICSPYIQSIINSKSVGDKAGFSADKCKKIVVPLPPLKEQTRIIGKLYKLLPEIEAYSEAEKEWDSLQKGFPDDIRKSVLQYAMQGKLVEQHPEEGAGEELYEQIAKEKEKLLKAGTIKKGKQPSNITDDDIPFDIPETWKWVRFGDIVDFRLGKTPPRVDAKSWGDDYRWVSISDMVSDGHISQTKEGISEAGFKSSFGSVISPQGTLIMSFKLTIGCVSILDIDALHNEAIISIFPIINTDNIMRDYLFKIMPYVSKYGDSKKAIKGNTLNSTSLRNLMVPLPPLGEQKRIVDKLNAIFPLLNAISEVV